MSHDATLPQLDRQFGPIANPHARLKTVSVKDLIEMDIPEREPLIEPILPTQGLMMIHAPRGVGKTYFGLNLAYAVASGTEYLTYTVPKARGVLFVDGEMPAATLRERLASIVEPDVEEIPLHLLTPDFNLDTGIPDISTPEGQSVLNHLLTDDIRLIILDNLSCLCRSGNENEAESWSFVQEWALQQRAAGRSIIFVHHSGKSGKQRGTSRREDVLDTVLSLRRPNDYAASEGARFEVHVEKGRTLFGQAADVFEAQLETDAAGRQRWQVTDMANTQDEEIIDRIKAGQSNADISRSTGLHRSTVGRRRKAAELDGRL